MKMNKVLVLIASVSTAIFPVSLFFGYASTAALIASVSAWLFAGLFNSYTPAEHRILIRGRNELSAFARKCPKSSLRLAA